MFCESPPNPCDPSEVLCRTGRQLVRSNNSSNIASLVSRFGERGHSPLTVPWHLPLDGDSEDYIRRFSLSLDLAV